MKWMTMAAAILIMSTSAHAQPSIADQVDVAGAEAQCRRQWQSDFSMQEFCLEQQANALAELRSREFDLPPELAADIVDMCLANWRTDADMVVFCLGQQEQAAAALRVQVRGVPADIASNIEGQCRRQWPADLDMVNFCRNEQAAAWRRLNGG